MRAHLRAVALACVVMVMLVGSRPVAAVCTSPLPNAATYNKYIPDQTEVPLVMSVSLQPVIITDISPRLQTFQLIGYLFMGWTDTRLAFNASKCNEGKSRYVLTGSDMDLVWRPQLEFPNSKGRSIEPEEVNVWDSGFSLYVGRLQLELHANLDVEMFPFDKHTLSVIVEEFDHPTPELILVADDKAELATLESSQFVFDDEITITKHLFHVPQRNTTWDQVTFSFHASRIWASTFVNTIVPVTLIVGMAVCAFLLPRQESTTRVSICITAFLSAIAFSVTLQSTLPPVRYITRMSLFIVMSYTVTFLCLLASVLVGVLYTQYKKLHQERVAKAKRTRLRKASVVAAEDSAAAAAARAVSNPLHRSIEMSERVAMARRASSGGVAEFVELEEEHEVRLNGKCRGGTTEQRYKATCAIVDVVFRFVVPVLYITGSFIVFNA